MLHAITDIKIMEGERDNLIEKLKRDNDILIKNREDVTLPRLPEGGGWIMDPVDLNAEAGGSDLFLAYRRDPDRQSQQDWITELTVVRSSATDGWQTDPMNLNEGAGGSTLYLAYQRGGKKLPIVAVLLISDKKENAPDGYEVLETDLNEGAGGKDLFLAFMRRDNVVPTLTIGRIFCITASTGFDATTCSMIVETVFTTLGAGAGALAGLSTGPGAVAVSPILAVGGAAAGAGIGTGLAKAIQWVGEKYGSEFTDDVYIKAGNKTVWPHHCESVEMKGGYNKAVNFTMPFKKEHLEIVIKEWDLVEDDNLGEAMFTPRASNTDVYLFFNTEEGSIFSVEIFIDYAPVSLKITNNASESFMFTNRRNSAGLLDPGGTTGSEHTFAGEEWTFTGVDSGIVQTYFPSDMLAQFLNLTTVPSVTVTNKTDKSFVCTNNRDWVGLLGPGETSGLRPTLKDEVWTFTAVEDRKIVQTHTASDQQKQSAIISLASVRITNMTNGNLVLWNSKRGEWFDTLMPGQPSELMSTDVGDYWRFAKVTSSDPSPSEYFASDKPNQSLIIMSSLKVYNRTNESFRVSNESGDISATVGPGLASRIYPTFSGEHWTLIGETSVRKEKCRIPDESTKRFEIILQNDHIDII